MTRQESDKRAKKMIDDKFPNFRFRIPKAGGLQPETFIAAILGNKGWK